MKKQWLIRLGSKQWVELIMVTLILLPLFFINMKDSHDWGDDFAMYIHQAKNITQGIPQTETGYIFNDHFPMIGPRVYPVGFPILLSPFYYFFGNNILAFAYCISLFLLGTCLLTFHFLRSYFSLPTSLLATIMVAYNPWTLAFKGEILSDIPFTFFLLLTISIYLKSSWYKTDYINSFWIGLSAGFFCIIRNVGMILLVALIIDFLYNAFTNRKKHSYFASLINLVVILITGSLVILCFSLLFHTGLNTYSFFSDQFNFREIGNILSKTTDYYITNFQNFFHPQVPEWNAVPLIIKAFALTFCIIGFIRKLFQKPDISCWITLFYLGFVALFPNTTQGFRYLFPVLPFLLFFTIYGLKAVHLDIKIHRYLIIGTVAIIMFFQYRPGINSVIKSSHTITKGPQEPEAVETWNFIKENTDTGAVIVFIKPRALALYAERKAIANNPAEDEVSMLETFNLVKPEYYLLTRELPNPALEKYLEKHEEFFQEEFRNAKFTLYGKRQEAGQ